MPSSKSLLAAASALALTSAFPAANLPILARQGDDHPYQAPKTTDSRAPCPALNTLANHGWINRNGRDVAIASISNAFLDAFGMDNTTISGALGNAFTVCHYVTGAECHGILPNLTLLAEPHTFEHDHSLSRQDYRMDYAKGHETNNQNFNATIFQSVIDVVGSNNHVDFQLANEIRLQRMSDALVQDYPHWFMKNIPTMATEMGFIFSVMGDFDCPDVDTNPQIRMDWWRYWFENESFPTPLGWHKPSKPRNSDFVTSVASRILTATVTSTPHPIEPDWINPTDKATPLPATATVPILPLPTNPPYVPANPPAKRDAAIQSASPASDRILAAQQAAQTQPVLLNPYWDEISLEQLAAQQAYAESKQKS